MAFWAENAPSKGGIYKTWTQQAKTARQLADSIEDILGADADLMSLTENEVSSLWTPGVADNALKRVSVLLRVSRWAQRQFRNTHGYRALTLEQGWQKTVSEACRSADEEIAHEQRYTVPELGRIWRLLMDPDAPIHPAIRYATLLGGEQRLGQVLATTVRHVTRVKSAWLVKPPQQPKKLTAWIALGTSQVEWFQELYAAAEQRPDGRLFPLSRGRAAKAWKKLETLADTQHFGWYGMRRAMIDLCDNARTDLLKNTDDPLDVSGDVVLDTISAHMPGGKRDAIYRNLPVGNRKAPLQPSGMWDILACATRVKLRARELAMERADSPL
jgi:integrase